MEIVYDFYHDNKTFTLYLKGLTFKEVKELQEKINEPRLQLIIDKLQKYFEEGK